MIYGAYIYIHIYMIEDYSMFFDEFSLSTLGTKLHSLCLLRGLAHASGRMNTLI